MKYNTISLDENIPDELKNLKQWVSFDQVHEEGKKKPKKIPYIAGTNQMAKSNDPTTFRTYDEVVKDVAEGRRDHIAFCVQEEDPYIVIDMDNSRENGYEHKLLAQQFQSYTERSVSGNGAHIILRGDMKHAGLHTQSVQVFHKNQFIIMTGEVYKYKGVRRDTIYPFTDKRLKTIQKNEISREKGHIELEEVEADMNPEELRKRCFKRYKEKFVCLEKGNWQGFAEYPSQSEADHALIHMYCSVSKSNELVRAMFMDSGLFRPEKGGGKPETYIDRTIEEHRADEAQTEKYKQLLSKFLSH